MDINKENIGAMLTQLDKWDIEIEKLKTQAESADTKVQLRYYKLIEVLRLRQNEVRQKLDELGHTEDDTWEALKQDIGNSWQELKTILSDTQKAFQEELEENKENVK